MNDLLNKLGALMKEPPIFDWFWRARPGGPKDAVEMGIVFQPPLLLMYPPTAIRAIVEDQICSRIADKFLAEHGAEIEQQLGIENLVEQIRNEVLKRLPKKLV